MKKREVIKKLQYTKIKKNTEVIDHYCRLVFSPIFKFSLEKFQNQEILVIL